MALVAWHNLIFLVPLLLGLIFVAGAAFGAAELGDFDLDLDVDADADADIDADVDGDADMDAHADGFDLLGALGVGKAPLSIVLMLLLTSFGVIGLGTKLVLAASLSDTFAALVAAGAATATSLPVTGLGARLVARFVPSVESYAASHDALIGALGTVELAVPGREALVRVTDETGTLHKLRCRFEDGALLKGMRVVVIDHDAERDLFEVERIEV